MTYAEALVVIEVGIFEFQEYFTTWAHAKEENDSIETIKLRKKDCIKRKIAANNIMSMK